MAEMSKGEQLYNAIDKSNNQKIMDILKNGSVDVNWQKPKDGITPLIMAAIRERKDVVFELLFNGANVNMVDKLNRTALYYATFGGSSDIIEILIDFGADINIAEKVTSYGQEYIQTPLDIANGQLEHSTASENKEMKNKWTNIIKILENKKPNPSPYFWVMCHDGVNLEILQKMLNIKDASGNRLVDINWTNADSEGRLTPLHIAAINGHVDVVKFLLEQGANPLTKDYRMQEIPIDFVVELEKHEEDAQKKERLTKIIQLLEVATREAEREAEMKAEDPKKGAGRKKTKARKIKVKGKLRKTRKPTKKSRKSYKRR
jgi:ankyrin repeat protein